MEKNKLKNLETIAIQLTRIIESEKEIKFNSIDINNKSSKELKTELTKLQIKNKNKLNYLKNNLKELEYLTNQNININSIKKIKKISTLVKKIKIIQQTIKYYEKTSEILNEVYKQKKLNEEGFKNYEEIYLQIDKLQKTKNKIKNKFLGKLFYKKELKELESKISSLNDLVYSKYFNIQLDEIKSEENKKIQNIPEKIFKNLTNKLFDEYNKFTQTLNQKKIYKKIDSSILDSLIEEYLIQYLKPRLKQKIETIKNINKYKKVQQKSIDIDQVLKISTNILNYSYELNTNEYNPALKKKLTQEKSKLKSLPEEIQFFINKTIFNGYETIKEEFIRINKNLIQEPINIEKKQLLKSLIKTKKKILKTLDSTTSYSLLNYYNEIRRKTENIEKRLKINNNEIKIPDLDLEKWNVFINNTKIQKLYHKDQLNNINKLIEKNIFDKLLKTPHHTNLSINLGYQALWFKKGKKIAYNILNFWRENGYSGEKPFLYIHEKSENTLAFKYIQSLTKDELNSIKKINIPEIIDLIEIIKKNPGSFRDEQIIMGDKRIKNPIYEQVQNKLKKICINFIKFGSQQEKIFALETLLNTNLTKINQDNKKVLINTISEYYDLDKKTELNFKKHYKDYISVLKSNFVETLNRSEHKKKLINLSKYYDTLDSLIERTKYPDQIKEEINIIHKDYNYLSNADKNLNIVIKYIEAINSENVQKYLNLNKNYKILLSTLRIKILNNNHINNNIKKYILNNFKNFETITQQLTKIVQSSKIKQILETEKTRLVNKLTQSDNLANNFNYTIEYLKTIDDNEIAKNLVEKDINSKNLLENLANIAYQCNQKLVSPLIKESIKQNISFKNLIKLKYYLNTIKINNYSNFINQLVNNYESKEIFNLLYSLSKIDDNESSELVSKINSNKISIDSINNAIINLNQNKLIGTSYLVEQLSLSKNQNRTIKKWLQILKSFNKGKFDSTNKLHKHLEYSRFRNIVDNEKMRTHLKNNFNFDQYLLIFNKKDSDLEFKLSEEQKFEIECLVEESKILRDYVLFIKEKADLLKKEVYVIPNLSYGYLPVSPLVAEFESKGIHTIQGIKVGSTESHNNKEVINKYLFKEFQEKIIEEQPILLIVDGTKHLIARDDKDKNARYPDAYQGYLNQIIAVNDALGFDNIDYSNAGKFNYDLIKLRQKSEFKDLVQIYKNLIKNNKNNNLKPYKFEFWNTAGMNLIIRNYHQKIKSVSTYLPKHIKNPTMIFCNVGLLDEQIPIPLKNKFKNLTHIPAYFDDSNIILNFNFSFDNYGIKYLNRLEIELKKAFNSKYGYSKHNPNISALVQYINNKAIN